MVFTKADIQLALYGEIIDEISRDNDELIDEKIEDAKGEMFGYLNRYDTVVMFGPDWQNAYFKRLCVSMIAWQLIHLSLPGVRQELIRTNYEDTIKVLGKIQLGTVRPDWPLRPEDPATNIDDAGNVQYSSNPKRRNHY